VRGARWDFQHLARISREEALAKGIDIFLAKPVQLSPIVATMKILLRLDL